MNVLDASAVMAVLGREPGAEEIAERMHDALMSAVNLAEVVQKAQQRGMDPREVQAQLGESGVGFVAFDLEQAVDTATLWQTTRGRGLSLADRSCLALAMAVSGTAVTTDRAWSGLEIDGGDIHVVRR